MLVPAATAGVSKQIKEAPDDLLLFPGTAATMLYPEIELDSPLKLLYAPPEIERSQM